jgi:hypothetical protein
LYREGKLIPLGRTTAAPSAISTEAILRPARTQTLRGGVRIAHREFIGNITNTMAFTATGLSLNPGLLSSFPWLAPQANLYEQYRFTRLCFHFLTRSPTTQSGTIILAPEYDAADPPPATEQQVTAYQDVVENVPWRDIVCTLDPRSMFPLGSRKFTRSGPVSFTDIKTYDAGTFYYCTTGSDTNLLGKLWVDYEVEFYTPQIPTTTPLGPTMSSFYTNAVSQSLISGITSSMSFPIQAFNALGIVPLVVGTGTNFVMPSGTYIITACIDTFGGVPTTLAGVPASAIFVTISIYAGAVLLAQTSSNSVATQNVSGSSIPLTLQAMYSFLAGTNFNVTVLASQTGTFAGPPGITGGNSTLLIQPA